MLSAQLNGTSPNDNSLDANGNQTDVTGVTSECTDTCTLLSGRCRPEQPSMPEEGVMEHAQDITMLSAQQTNVQSSKWTNKWKSSRSLLQQRHGHVQLMDAVIIQQYSAVEEARSVPESEQEPDWNSQLAGCAQLPKAIEETTSQRSRSPSESSSVSFVPSTVLTTISDETLEDVAVPAATYPGFATTPPVLTQKANITPLPAWMLKWMSGARKAELDAVFDCA